MTKQQNKHIQAHIKENNNKTEIKDNTTTHSKETQQINENNKKKQTTSFFKTNCHKTCEQ